MKSIILITTLAQSQTLILIKNRTIGMSTSMKPSYKQLNFKKIKVAVNNLRILHNVSINCVIMNLPFALYIVEIFRIVSTYAYTYWS